MNKVQLGDIADIELGKMLDAGNNKGSLHPYLANINVRWGNFNLNDLPQMPFEDDEAERFLLRDGDLVMCEGGEPGRCAIWHEQLPDVRYQKALHRIRPHDDVDVRWLYYWFLLQGRIGGLNQYINQTTIKHLVREDLKKVEIDLPSLSTQQHIANVLSAIDEKIENNRKIMAELEATARLVYDEWFVQFDFPDKDGRPYRSGGGKMIWDKATKREIPKGWTAAPIGALISIEHGFSYSATDLVDDEKGCPMINLASIDRQHRYRPEGLKYLSPALSVDNVVHSGDMLMACTDLTRLAEIVGCPIRVPLALKSAAFSMDLARVNVNKPNIIDSWYLYMTLRTDHYHAFIKQFASGTNVLHLNLKGLDWYEISIPPIKLQQRFANLAQDFWKQANVLAAENQRLSNLRDWLLPMLINGQLSVQ